MLCRKVGSLLVLACTLPVCSLTEINKWQSGQTNSTQSTNTFLRRALHAATVVGDFLYIDGGFSSYNSGSGPVIENVTDTLSLDLSQDWTNSSVTLLSTSKPDAAPQTSTRELFYHNDALYTGFTAQTPQPISLWNLSLDGKGK